MTKQHFIALADTIRDIGLTESQIMALANFCHKQNPRFKCDRWIGYIRGTNGKNGGAVKRKVA